MSRDSLLKFLACSLVVGIFILDLRLELGMAAGTPYILPVLVAVWVSSKRWILAIGGVSLILVCLGFFLSPEGGEQSKVLFNRGVALLAIFVTTLLGFRAKSNFIQLQDFLYREKKQERYIASVLNNLVDGVIVINSQGIIQSVNSAVSNLFGYDPSEMVGQNIKMLMPEPYAGEHDHYLQNYLSTGEAKIIGIGRELQAIRKDATVFPIYLAISEIETEGGNRHFVGILRDITDQKVDEEQLQEYARELERSNRALQEFAFVASHDLKEPLRKISYFTSMFQDPDPSISRRECEEKIIHSVSRMKSLLDGLLSLSKIRTKERERQVVPLSMVLEEVITALEVRILETRAEVRVEPLPDVHADPLMMHQLFQNLISNALKFQPPGNTPEVKVQCRANTIGHWEIEVADNGIGIPEEFQSKIFEPLKRLHGRSEYEGTGLGLAICREIVHIHEGSLGIESVPGEGSVFLITLPDNGLDVRGKNLANRSTSQC